MAEWSHAILGTMVIRAALATDARDLVGLFADWDHPQPEPVIETILAEWARRDDRLILVAVDGEDLAGLAAVASLPHLSRPGSSARLVGLVVDAAHRRRGVARRLLGAAEDLARGWGCDQMELTSARIRPEAHAFYPALGYEETSGHHARYVKKL